MSSNLVFDLKIDVNLDSLGKYFRQVLQASFVSGKFVKVAILNTQFFTNLFSSKK